MAVTALPPSAMLSQGLSAAQSEKLASVARTLTLDKGERLFQLGGDAEDLFIVRSGLVELTLDAPVAGATHRVVVQEASPGETIGWSALVPPHQYTLDAFAVVGSTVLTLSRDELMTMCKDHPALGTNVLNNLLVTVGRRLHVVHALWARELRRNLEREYPAKTPA